MLILGENELNPLLWSLVIGLMAVGTVIVSSRFLTLGKRTSPSGCPFAASSSVGTREMPSNSSKENRPDLVHLPVLPLIGSYLTSYSGMPPVSIDRIFDWRPLMRSIYGDFYCYGSPTIGTGLFKKVYCVTDPQEMNKVLYNEGKYPLGIVGFLWAFVAWGKETRLSIVQGDDTGKGFFGNGETWRRLRTFLLKDLYPPPAVKSYTESIITAARLASQGVTLFQGNMNTYTARVGFDVFYSIMFGRYRSMATDKVENAEDEVFCTNALSALELTIPLMQPRELFQYKLGIRTQTFKLFCTSMNKAAAIAKTKVQAFRKQKEEDLLSATEQDSYVSKVIDRQKNDKSITYEEMVDLLFLVMSVSIDTTSAVLNWTLLHLALNPDVQSRLRDEVMGNTDNSGNITQTGLLERNAPYMVATLRETHRITSAVPANCVKRNGGSDVDIHGVKIAKGNVFILDSFSPGLDPNLVDNPNEFRPERWLPEAVRQREGTAAAILDHKLYAGPFSEGARKCPASRVATVELHAVLAHLVKDWEFSVDDESVKSYKDVQYYFGLAVQPRLPKFQFTKRYQGVQPREE